MTIGISPLMVQARRLRESTGVSQERLGRESGFSHLCVHRWETGKHHPSILAVETYLEALGYRLKIERIPSSVTEDLAA